MSVVRMEESYKPTATREMDNLGGCDEQGRYMGGYVEDAPSKAELPYRGQVQYPSQSTEPAPLVSEDTCQLCAP